MTRANVDQRPPQKPERHWRTTTARAAPGGVDSFDVESHVPFPETRAYVENVLDTRGDYHDHHADDLGI